jgi:hypothetical protein
MDILEVVKKIETYSADTGLQPSTICQNALGNARFYERQLRRAESNEKALLRIQAYIDANPVGTG